MSCTEESHKKKRITIKAQQSKTPPVRVKKKTISTTDDATLKGSTPISPNVLSYANVLSSLRSSNPRRSVQFDTDSSSSSRTSNRTSKRTKALKPSSFTTRRSVQFDATAASSSHTSRRASGRSPKQTKALKPSKLLPSNLQERMKTHDDSFGPTLLSEHLQSSINSNSNEPLDNFIDQAPVYFSVLECLQIKRFILTMPNVTTGPSSINTPPPSMNTSSSNKSMSTACVSITKKHKNRTAFQMKDDFLYMDLRNKFTNIVQGDFLNQISAFVHNNFSSSRHHKEKNISRASKRLKLFKDSADIDINIDTTFSESTQADVDAPLSNFRRCYLEDFMVIPINTTVLVLIPDNIDDIEDADPFSSITFGLVTYHIYFGSILTSPERNKVLNGTTFGEIEFGLSNGNFGSRILLKGTDNEIEVSWKEVLAGGKTGIQVWKEGGCFRSVWVNFVNRRKKVDSCKELLGVLHLEVFGDRIQCFHLLLCYYRAVMSQQTIVTKHLKNTIAEYEPILLQGDEFVRVLQMIDKMYYMGLQECYTEFTSIGSPIVSTTRTNFTSSQSKPAPMQPAVAPRIRGQ